MKEIEVKLRAGMTANGIEGKAQDKIVQFITSFALYGFPESHSASFALLAYASAFLKVRYLAAFTAALLNNQPMGFYSAATIVKDAQRHGLVMKPIDVTRSQWNCSLEGPPSSPALRIGLRYVRGLQRIAADDLVRAREQTSFTSTEDLARRVPSCSRADLMMFARIGALNRISTGVPLHRRDALWQVEKAARRVRPLLEGIVEQDAPSPLLPMNSEERLVSDYYVSGMTTGPHPMAYRRKELQAMNIITALELRRTPNGKKVTIAGSVITRQRPGTAKGLIFITLEDETGHANVIIMPDFYEENRHTVIGERFVRVYGTVQNHDGIVHLRAEHIAPLGVTPSRIFPDEMGRGLADHVKMDGYKTVEQKFDPDGKNIPVSIAPEKQ